MLSEPRNTVSEAEVRSCFLRPVVLGIGNLLRSDDGVGIHALRRLRQHPQLPARVRLIDGGTVGPALLPHLEGCDALLIIDAVDAGKPPGEVFRLQGQSVPAAWEQKISMHQAGVADLLTVLRLQNALPSCWALWCMQPGSLDWTTDLSPCAARSLDRLVECVVSEVRSWELQQTASGLTPFPAVRTV